MEQWFKKLGWKDKEIHCYLALLEFGQLPASVLAKKLKMPKATVLFTLHRLVERGYVIMTKRGKTEYFFADPKDLEQSKKVELEEMSKTLEHLIPLLKESKNPLTSPPKVSFFQGVEACKKAYAQVLDCVDKEALEFITHDDLADKFGAKWIDDFIVNRIKNKVFIRSITHDNPLYRKTKKVDKKELREVKLIPKKKGKMYSGVVMFDNKLLLLNLSSDAFGILIENSAIVETMKTIHRLSWNTR